MFIYIFVYIFPLCSILIFEDSFVNHLSVKLISSIKIIIIINCSLSTFEKEAAGAVIEITADEDDGLRKTKNMKKW